MLSLFRSLPVSKSGILIVTLAISVLSTSVSTGQADSVKTFKNSVRFSLTNPVILGTNCWLFGYERILNDHQSFSVGFGKFGLPWFGESTFDSIGVSNEYNDRGFNLSFDYRFYLRKENRYKAPHGVYIGPYYAYNSLSRDIAWDLATTSYTGMVNSHINLTANLIGVQMGYQFILWNRISIDMILVGPGVWFYGLKTKFDTTLPEDEEEALLQRLNDLLDEKFPGNDFTATGGGFDAKRTTTTSSMGFRYMINLGFRF